MEAERTESAEILPLDRYIRAVSICNNLALLASQGTMVQFLQRVAILTRLQRYWTKGYDTVQISCADATEADDDDGADDLDPGAASLVPVTGPEDWDARSDSTVDLKPDVSSMAVEQSVSDSGASDLDQDDADYTPVPKKEPAADRKKKFACSECGETFRFRTMLKRHEATKHQAPTSDVAATPTAAEDVTAEATKTSKDVTEQAQASADRSTGKYVFDFTEMMEGQRTEDGDRLEPKDRSLTKSQTSPTGSSYMCIFCNVLFPDQISLQKHERWRHAAVGSPPAQNLFKCSHCGQDFSLLSSLRRHEKLHLRMAVLRQQQQHDSASSGSSSQRFKCSKCGQLFRLLSSLHQHELIDGCPAPVEVASKAIQSTGFKCAICGKMFTSTGSLKRHENRFHTSDTDCREMLPSTDEQQQQQDQGSPFKCSCCSQLFTRTSSLKRHEKKVHDKISIEVPKQRTENALVLPQSGHPNSALSNIGLRKQQGERTRRSTVSVSKKYMCSTCGRRFTCQQALLDHIRTHTGERPYACRFPGCEKRFAQQSTLKYHECTHSELTPYMCTVCGRQFKHSTLVRLHSRVHSDVLPFSCHECGLSFRRSSSLQRHLRVHTGEAPYACPDCPKRFKNHGARRRHVAAIHKQLKPFVCTVCNKAFTQPGNLRIHMRTHTNEKPYVCPICGMKFSYSGSLKGHLQTHMKSTDGGQSPSQPEHYGSTSSVFSNSAIGP